MSVRPRAAGRRGRRSVASRSPRTSAASAWTALMAACSWYGPGWSRRRHARTIACPSVDQGPVPARAVLLAEQHERAVGVGSRRATRLGQQQQRQQAGDLRLVGHQRRQQPRQPDRLSAQLRVLRAGVVDQVDDGQHRRQAGGQLVIVRHAVRDPGRLDLALGPHEPLGHRRLGHQERSRDLLGREPAEQPQRERHLGFRSERRVAAREDETQPVVLHGSSLLRRARVVVVREQRHVREQLAAARLAAQAIDGEIARGRRDPATRVGRQPVARPAAQGDRVRILHGVLGDVDVAEDADQRGDRATGRLAEDPADRGLAGRRRHAPSVCMNGRTSIGRMMHSEVLAPQASAASRSSASTM